MADQPKKTATITLDSANSDRQFPAYQISINAMSGEKSGHGYRLMGPKYVGRSRNLRTVELTQWAADEIRAILDEVFPTEVVVDCADVELESGENLRALGVGNDLDLDEPTAGMQPGTWRLTAYADDGTARMRRLSGKEIQAARAAEAFARMNT
ncbi:hypothetical protein [Streptomyces sp. SID161]|uniref:hypothetical protein n=1 Tax=Streptomyces sp. SID161 TaxID=2690251 RepID=UPI00136F8900|nr:hypothetical protein [Streptomyces sp. SID161]MYW46350.1 hypothetical protein [Streptomyces sp. SID161]